MEENLFESFPKIPRYSRECIISEKIDGTNAQIHIIETDTPGAIENADHAICYNPDRKLMLFAGSRSRWITPDNDNHGFAKWVYANAEELAVGLGPGRHFGEWWGQGIQRNYGLKEKRFSLFNVIRWDEAMFAHVKFDAWVRNGCKGEKPVFSPPPACCHVVPVITTTPFETRYIEDAMSVLFLSGSFAAPGFSNPEGIVIFHIPGGVLFKKTFHHDDGSKGGR